MKLKRIIALTLCIFVLSSEYSGVVYADELEADSTETTITEEEPEEILESTDEAKGETSEEIGLEESVEDTNTEVQDEESDELIFNEEELCGNIDVEMEEIKTIEPEDGVNYAVSIPSYYACDSSGKIQLPDYIPMLRFQYNGTCWAHSSTALAEISMIKQGYIDKADTDYSELHLAYFAYNQVIDPLGGITNDINGWIPDAKATVVTDRGGNLIYSQNVLANWVGSADESVANEYNSADQTKVDTTGLDAELAFADEAILTDFYDVNLKTNPDEAKTLILENGAIGASYYSNQSYYNSTYNSFYNYNNTSTNHAITIIGWNDNFPASNFTTAPSGNGAWLVRNSWYNQSKYGNNYYGTTPESYNGYFWMSYYDKSLSTAAYSFRFVPANTYAHNYQYDGGMYASSNSCIKAANVFKVKANAGGKEVLESASFYVDDTNVDYTIYIYRFDAEDNTYLTNPEGGELLTSQEGHTIYEGYYTVPLDEKQVFSQGERFSVVVSFENDESGTSYIGCERAITYSDWCKSTVSANAGESFIMSYGTTWSDYGDTRKCNLKIKAFTNNYTGSVSNSLTDFDLAEDYSEGLFLKVNDRQRIKLTLTPANANVKDITFTSSNTSAVTVSSTGYISAVGVGKATITLSATVNGSKKTKTIDVVVASIKVTDSNGNTTISTNPGKTRQLVATIESSSDVELGEVVWSTSDSQIATIDQEGLATFKKVGTVVLTASNEKYSSSITASVRPASFSPQHEIDEDGVLTFTWDEIEGVDSYQILDKSGKEICNLAAGKESYSITYSDLKGMDIARTYFAYKTKYTLNGLSTTSSYGAYIYVGKAATINYNLDGGTNNSRNVTKAKAGSNAYFYYPTKTGYNFSKWTDEEGNTRSSIYVTETKTWELDANWTPIQYGVFYYDYDGYNWTYDTLTYDGEYYTIRDYPEDGSKPSGNSTFLCWNDDYFGLGTDYYPGESVRNLVSSSYSSVALYPRWTTTSNYVITYYLWGGVNNSENPYEYNSEDGPFTLRAPTRTGYTFVKWTDSNNKTVTQITESNANGLELSANWTPNKYTVKFDKNDADATGTMYDQIYKYGSNYVLPSCGYSATGKTFKGWCLQADGKSKIYENSASVSNLSSAVNGTVTLYAIWKENTYTISFEAGGITANPSDMSATYGEAIGTLPSPTATGYVFKGWFTAPEGGEQIKADTVYNQNYNLTLYAHWEKVSYQVQFKANGGTFVDNNTDSYIITVDHGCIIDSAYIPKVKYQGKTFDKWTIDLAGNTEFSFSTPITGVTTLYAQWTDLKCEAPTANYESGAVLDEGTKIELYTETEGASIYFTTDGSEPTVNANNLYTEPFAIDRDLCVKAMTVLEGLPNSKVSTFYYEVSLGQGEVLDKDLDLFDGDTKNAKIKEIPEGLWISAIDETTYNGKAQAPQFRVYFGKKKLKAGTDYTVSNKQKLKYINAGIYDLVITGKGNYKDVVETEYEILQRDVTEELNDLLDYSVVNNSKSGTKPAFNIYADGRKLVPDTVKKGVTTFKDYSLDWTNEKGETNSSCRAEGDEAFTTEVTITAHGNYTGLVTKAFTVNPSTSISIASSKVKISFPEIAAAKNVMTYQAALNEAGEIETKPALEIYLDLGKDQKEYLDEEDFSVKYLNNKAFGTASVIISGKGNYYGSVTKKFTIKGTALSGYKIDFAYYTPDGSRIVTSSQNYSGSEYKPDFRIVSKKDGSALIAGVDYTYTYSNNVNKGKGKLTVKGINGYYGTISSTFTINPYSFSYMESLYESETASTQTYTRGLITVTYSKVTPYTKQGGKPDIKVYFKVNNRNVLLKENTDYKVAYTSNKLLNSDKTFFTITFKGNYVGKFTISNTSTFKGCYYKVTKQSITNMNITASDKAGNSKKNGYKVTPVITDPRASNTKLVAGTDYEKVFKYYMKDEGGLWQEIPNNTVINPSYSDGPVEIKVSVTGKNNYFIEGQDNTLETTYKIFPSVNLVSNSKYVMTIDPQVYTGKAITLDKSDIVIDWKAGYTPKDGEELPTLEDFEIVSYKNNIKKGNASLTIKGTGDFGGSRTIKFAIAQKSISDAAIKTRPSTNNLLLQWFAY